MFAKHAKHNAWLFREKTIYNYVFWQRINFLENWQSIRPNNFESIRIRISVPVCWHRSKKRHIGNRICINRIPCYVGIHKKPVTYNTGRHVDMRVWHS